MSRTDKFERTLLFSTSDDLYFLTYNILVTLDFLDCKGAKKFKDVNKLAFIIEFISNRELIMALDKPQHRQDSTDRFLLSQAFSNGLMRINAIKRVLYNLDKKNYIEFSENQKEIWLVDSDKIKKLFSDEFFEYEKQNLALLKTKVLRLNNITVNTFLDNTFSKMGISSWAIFS